MFVGIYCNYWIKWRSEEEACPDGRVFVPCRDHIQQCTSKGNRGLTSPGWRLQDTLLFPLVYSFVNVNMNMVQPSTWSASLHCGFMSFLLLKSTLQSTLAPLHRQGRRWPVEEGLRTEETSYRADITPFISTEDNSTLLSSHTLSRVRMGGD